MTNKYYSDIFAGYIGSIIDNLERKDYPKPISNLKFFILIVLLGADFFMANAYTLSFIRHEGIKPFLCNGQNIACWLFNQVLSLIIMLYGVCLFVFPMALKMALIYDLFDFLYIKISRQPIAEYSLPSPIFFKNLALNFRAEIGGTRKLWEQAAKWVLIITLCVLDWLYFTGPLISYGNKEKWSNYFARPISELRLIYILVFVIFLSFLFKLIILSDLWQYATKRISITCARKGIRSIQ